MVIFAQLSNLAWEMLVGQEIFRGTLDSMLNVVLNEAFGTFGIPE